MITLYMLGVLSVRKQINLSNYHNFTAGRLILVEGQKYRIGDAIDASHKSPHLSHFLLQI